MICDSLSITKYNSQEPCIHYAQYVLAGKLQEGGEQVFVELVTAMTTKQNKEECGVGLQNTHYFPGILEIAHIISIHSQRTYQSMSHVLPPPTQCSIQ